MLTDIKIPDMGESVRTGVVARWLKNDGDQVKADEVVMELETDKITGEINAPAAGKLIHKAKVGDTVAVGAVVAQVDTAAVGKVSSGGPTSTSGGAGVSPAAKSAPAPASPKSSNGSAPDVRATPLAEKVAAEKGVDLSKLHGTGPGGKVREQDVLTASQPRPAPVAAPRPAATTASSNGAGARRERLTPLRARIAQRLVEAQHTAAMLTTFNEVDMTAVMELRKRYKEDFEKKHNVGLGFMSFFVKAVCGALRQFPTVNAYLVSGPSGIEVEHHDSMDIALAVSTPKGLTVPVLRNCQSLSFAQIEQGIKDLAGKARDGKLTLDDLQGGTFTITNGGVFGSLISTPILNAPQSAILGMHTIKNRPVEHPDQPGQIALRPMMYLALSYDHRLLDGSEAVQFLVAIKNAIEKPERLMLGL
jgi:2-oxoglutarate dehydrogenase E2 component (dihydrolipoamide succinyltransferase)